MIAYQIVKLALMLLYGVVLLILAIAAAVGLAAVEIALFLVERGKARRAA